MSNEQKHEEFMADMKHVFNTEAGLRILARLKDDYVNSTAVDSSSVEMTYYKLGQKEFIQTLLQFVKNQDEVDDIIVENSISSTAL
jgi:hypothetical protein